MSDQTITTRMELDLSPYRKALEKMPKDAQKALKKLERTALSSAKKLASAQEKLSKRTASTVSKHARDQARATQKAAKDTERAYNEQFSSIMGLSGAAFGGMAGDAEDFAIAMSGASGPMAALGVGLGALAMGPVILGGLASAAKGLADSGAEALAELREMGPAVAALVSPAAAAALDDYTDTMERLDLAANVASVEIGGALAPGLGEVADELVGLIPLLTRVAELWATGAKATQWTRDAQVGLLSWVTGVGEADATVAKYADALDKSKDALEEKTSAYAPLISAQEAARVVAENLARAEASAAVANKKHAAALALLEREALEDIRAGQKAQAEADAAVVKASEAMKSHGHVVRDTMGDVDGLVNAEGNLAFAVDDSTEAVRTAAEKYADAMDEMGEASRKMQAIGGEAFGAMQAFADLAADAAMDEARANKDRAKQRTAEIKNLKKLLEGATDAEQADIERRIEMRQDERETQRKAAKDAAKDAKKAWKVSKAAQVSSAVMNKAAAMLAYLAPPPMGLGPVLGPAAAVLAAVGMAAEIATIKAQKPPAFHTGGIVGAPRQEVPAMLEAGEGIIRREAMLQPGAADALQRMNEGGAGGGVQPMSVYLNDRLVDVLIARAERTDARGRRGLAMVGTRTMYDRRR